MSSVPVNNSSTSSVTASGDNAGSSAYEKEYIPYIIKWGRFTNLVGFIASLLPVLVLFFVFGLLPPVSAILAGALSQASVSGVFWFVEPISYFPILGIPGTYMAFLSGNIANLRVPAAAVAQEAAGVEFGSEKGAVISTIGVGVSIIVNTLMLTVGVILGASILSKMPDSVKIALNYILPALFGGLFAQFAVPRPKIACCAISIACIMTFMLKKGVFSFIPGPSPAYLAIATSVFATIFIAKIMYKSETKE